MAAEDKSKPGGGFSGSGGPNQADPGASDAKKDRKRSLDTQSLKVLAPRSEVARSALEMRENLENLCPPAPSATS